MDAVLLEWRQHEIDEVGFHHGSQVCVFENTKLAIPYSLLPSIAEEAWAAFLKAKAGEASNMAAASLALVIVDGNHYTAWNARKLYLKDVNDPAALYEEIRVSAAILRKHPKSAVGWAHRQWVLQRLLQLNANFNVDDEWQLVEETATTYPKNYYAWSHRMWLLQVAIPSLAKTGDNMMTLLQQDFDRLKVWMKGSLGDYSAYHYEYEICNGMSESNLENSLGWVQERIDYHQKRNQLYPGHEALVLHLHRLEKLLQTLISATS